MKQQIYYQLQYGNVFGAGIGSGLCAIALTANTPEKVVKTYNQEMSYHQACANDMAGLSFNNSLVEIFTSNGYSFVSATQFAQRDQAGRATIRSESIAIPEDVFVCRPLALKEAVTLATHRDASASLLSNAFATSEPVDWSISQSDLKDILVCLYSVAIGRRRNIILPYGWEYASQIFEQVFSHLPLSIRGKISLSDTSRITPLRSIVLCNSDSPSECTPTEEERIRFFDSGLSYMLECLPSKTNRARCFYQINETLAKFSNKDTAAALSLSVYSVLSRGGLLNSPAEPLCFGSLFWRAERLREVTLGDHKYADNMLCEWLVDVKKSLATMTLLPDYIIVFSVLLRKIGNESKLHQRIIQLGTELCCEIIINCDEEKASQLFWQNFSERTPIRQSLENSILSKQNDSIMKLLQIENDLVNPRCEQGSTISEGGDPFDSKMISELKPKIIRVKVKRKKGCGLFRFIYKYVKRKVEKNNKG